jgi:hypothetical protein
MVTSIFVQEVEDPSDTERQIYQAARAPVPDLSGVDVTGLPEPVMIGRNHPNPFRTKTAVSFAVASAGRARLGIYTLEGRLVTYLLDGHIEQGAHSVVWDGRDRSGQRVGPGVYYYRIETERGTGTGKMILLR